MSLMHRNLGNVLHPSYLLLYALFLVNIGLFTLFLLEYWLVDDFAFNWHNFMLLTASFTAIYIGKHLLLSILSWIFPFDKELRLYSFSIAIFNMMIGLLLFPLNILNAYTPPGFHTSLIYLGLGVILVILLLRTLRALLMANRYLLFHKFHFLLYLCGVELAPVLILVKVIENQGAII